MNKVILYWSNICVLNRSELAFLSEVKSELASEGIDLEVRFFGLGYPCHMSEFLFNKSSELPDMILSTDLEVFEDRRIYSRFEDSLYDISSWCPLKPSEAIQSLVRDPRLMPYLAIPLLFSAREKQASSLKDVIGTDVSFGGIDNSAAKSVVKTVWYLYGRDAASALLRKASVMPMPIAAFQRVRTGQSSLAIVPSLFALSDEAFKPYMPEEGAIAIPSYIAVRRTISADVGRRVIRALNSEGFLKMYAEKGKMLTASAGSPDSEWFDDMNGKLVLPDEAFISLIDPLEFYGLYSEYIPGAHVLG